MSKEAAAVGFAFCGSYCAYRQAMAALEQTAARFAAVVPIVSEHSAQTDTRFGNAHDHMREMERICGRRVISTIAQAEPIGPKGLLDALVIAPCTGNTLAKLAAGVTDTTVTMAAKAQLRNGRPVVLAVSTNDGLGVSLRNLGERLCRKHIYAVPFRQDDPAGKPASLMADMSLIPEAVLCALKGRQLQPVVLAPLEGAGGVSCPA